MNRLQLKHPFLWIVICEILLVCVLVGCSSTIQPTQLPGETQNRALFVPEGCKIGDITAPENGVYISESLLIETMIQLQKEEQRRNQKRRI